MIFRKSFLSCLFLGIGCLSGLCSCDNQNNDSGVLGVFGIENKTPEPTEIHALSDLAGKRTGELTGSVFHHVLQLQQAGAAEYLQFDQTQLLVNALLTGKIDAVLEDEPIAQLLAAFYPEDLYVAFTYKDDNYSFATRKGDPLNARISAVIQQLEQSGELEKFKEKWCKSSDQNRHITEWTHKADYDGSAGTIRYATDPTQAPMVYQAYNELMGMDIETLNRVAYELNMKVEYTFINFADLLNALQEGKADLVGGCMSVTPKRQERVDFVHPYYKGGMAVLARYIKKKAPQKAE